MTTQSQTEVLKMALEVMRNQGDVSVDEWIATENAIKEALAQQSNEQVEPEPDGVVVGFTDDGKAIVDHDGLEEGLVLYTHPPVPYVVEPRTAQPKEPAVAEHHKEFANND